VPTILTHPAVALLKTWCPRLSGRVAATGAFLSILPDFDVIAFPLGIPYEHLLGHRGITHSIAFAVAMAALATSILRDAPRRPAFLFLLVCALAHPLLDALTDGGLGVALFAPFSNERIFFAWTPIRVSPIGAGFFSARGMETVWSEVRWVWGPVGVIGILGKYARDRKLEARKER